MTSQADVVVHLVHGTFDAREKDVAHWSDSNGLFAEGVKDSLPEEIRGRVRFQPFDWSGINSFEERNNASDNLAKVMLENDERPRLFVGHSHGGTVIADALVKSKKPKTAGVLTLATPFVARMIDSNTGPLTMTLFAPILAFWFAMSGSLALAIHDAWIGAGFLLITAVLSLLGFTDGRRGREASLLGSLAILLVPIAFLISAIWDSNYLSSFSATLVGVILVIVISNKTWSNWVYARLSPLYGVPSDTEIPPAPDVSLTALRLPGDEASYAIVAAQALVWLETKNILGRAKQWFKDFNAADGRWLAIVALALWLLICCSVALFSEIQQWWLVLIIGTWWMCLGFITLPILVGAILLFFRVLTTLLLAKATGAEVLYGISAIKVYSEPLPRWQSHKRCHLEILGWTEEDAKQMPPLRHSMHRLGFVHRRVADWLVERLEK